VRAVQVGGPLGAYFPPSMFHLPFDYEAFAQAGGLIGHAGITVFDDSVDMAHMARFAMEFCAAESCGKCTPCRIGSTRGVEIMDRIIGLRGSSQSVRAEPVEALSFSSKKNGPSTGSGRTGQGYLDSALYSRSPDRIDVSIEAQTNLLRDLADTMKYGSLCALGGFTPYPVLSALDYFPEDFGASAPVKEAAE
jgi:formate dehydrogenase iron-sulfur subunit